MRFYEAVQAGGKPAFLKKRGGGTDDKSDVILNAAKACPEQCEGNLRLWFSDVILSERVARVEGPVFRLSVGRTATGNTHQNCGSVTAADSIQVATKVADPSMAELCGAIRCALVSKTLSPFRCLINDRRF